MSILAQSRLLIDLEGWNPRQARVFSEQKLKQA
jgi:hypothetical protein